MTIHQRRTASHHPEIAFTIQPALHEEIGTVQALAAEVGLYTSSLTFQNSTYWIARLAGEPVGCIGLEHGEEASLLRSAAVLPVARGLGVGRALAQSALTLASLRGDRAVYLFSTGAGVYWQRLGFVEVPVAELEATLLDTPQVRSGQCKGWIKDEITWKRVLAQ